MPETMDRPFWWDAAGPQPAEYESLPKTIDVAIIGGGYTGMGAALPLARAGRQVAVIERDRPGDGASSRNGGITSGNLRLSFAQLVSKFGTDKAKAFYAEGVTARADLYAFIKAEKLDCDYQDVGRFSGAMTPGDFDGLRRSADLLHRHVGIETEVIQRADQFAEIGSELYHGGTRRPDIGGLHPGKLHRELRRVAEAAGAKLYGGTAVIDIQRVGAVFDVKTSRGTIRAKHVIVATNGYSDKGVPWLRKRVVPVISEMIATQPLSPNLMQTLMPKRQMHSETAALGHYYRPSPDGTRLLLGGRRYHNDPGAARERLRAALVSIFPEVADTELSHHWFGFVAFPMDQLPKLDIHDGIIYAAGFCGSGVVWARWMGAKAASLVLGLEDKTVFAEDRFPTIPLYNGTPWFLPLMMNFYRLKDNLSGKGRK